MKKVLHLLAAIVATSLIALFFSSTLLVELFGSVEAIATVKRLIVFPGLFILVPAIAATGGSGFALAKARRGALVQAKLRRMPFIAANGILVLVPCAIVLNLWASRGALDASFYAVQVLELVAGAVNLWLMGLNLRDGLRLSGRLTPPPLAPHVR